MNQGIVLAVLLCAEVAAPTATQAPITGLIEIYTDLVAELPDVSHRRRADELNARLPELMDRLDSNAVGFYVAPADHAVMRLRNTTQGPMVARSACYTDDGALLSTGDWFTLKPGKRRDLACNIEGSWIFVEWGSDEPAPGAIHEIRENSELHDRRRT